MFRFADFFVVELTLSCNLNCEYCYLKGRHEYTGMVMSDETFQSFIDHIVVEYNRKPNALPPTLVMHGGEPLLIGVKAMRSKLEYASKTFKELNIPYNISVQTNGTLITKEFADLFTEYGVDLGISYDGDEDHNKLRTKNDKMEKTILTNIQTLKDSGTRFGVLSVISNENLHYIKEFERKLGSKVKRIRVTDTSSKKSTIETDPIEYFEVLEKDYVESLEWVHKPKGNIHHDLDRMLFRAVLDNIADHSESCQSTCGFPFCGAGIRILAIQPNGAVHRCDRWDLKYRDQYYLHTPFSYDFLGIHQLQKAVEWNKTLHEVNIKTGCDTCYAKYICGHQCQSLYYSKMGEYGVDKGQICARTKAIYNFVSENIEIILNKFVERGSFPAIEDVIYDLKLRTSSKLRGANYRITDDGRAIEFKS